MSRPCTAPILALAALLGCARQATPASGSVSCPGGRIDLLDCQAEARSVAGLASEPARPERTGAAFHNVESLVAASDEALRSLAGQVLELCDSYDRCGPTLASYRSRKEELATSAASLRRLRDLVASGQATPAQRRALTEKLAVSLSCPAEDPLDCHDGSCAPPGALCCGDGLSCPSGTVCCEASCCSKGSTCDLGTCHPRLQCGGATPMTCPDGSCAPAGATCCGGEAFCRTGACCGDCCCGPGELCRGGACTKPAPEGSCTEARPFLCMDGSCVPPGGACCGGGRTCTRGVCCGAGCCDPGQTCLKGACVTTPPDELCVGDWPLTCPGDACAPALATCCEGGRYCEDGAQCCGADGCCSTGETCVAGTCLDASGKEPSCGGDNPQTCPDGSCAPASAACCGKGRMCLRGTCCGEADCCEEGETCVNGQCSGRQKCHDPFPVECPDGSCAPPASQCCGNGKYCERGLCCGENLCCKPDQVCVQGKCLKGTSA